MIKIIANGKSFEIQDGKTIAEFVISLGLKPQRCVVELNKKALTFVEFKNVILKSGDVLEIMSLVAGG